MVEAGDIVALSIPFVAGVAAVAWTPLGEVTYPVAGCCCAASALGLFLACGDGRRLPFLLAAYFFAGALCCCTAMLSGPSGVRSCIPAEHCLDRLVRLIDGCPVGNDARALMAALLTGRKESLDASTVAEFRASGAAHILALSGLHLGVIYGILLKLLAVLGHSRPASLSRSVVIVAACAFYCLMTGASPSLVRAFLFVLFNELSRHCSGRRRRPAAVLCAALTVQLCFDPLTIKSAGFQLSYLAMAGVLTIFPRLDSWYPPGRGPVRRIWSSMAVSISCQLTTAPLVWLLFRSFPRCFLLTNLLALPLVELLMLSSVVTLTLSAAGVEMQAAAFLTDKLAAALEYCMRIIAGL